MSWPGAYLEEKIKKRPDKLLLQKLNTAMKNADMTWQAKGKKVHFFGKTLGSVFTPYTFA